VTEPPQPHDERDVTAPSEGESTAGAAASDSSPPPPTQEAEAPTPSGRATEHALVEGGFWTSTGMPSWIPRLLLLIVVVYAVASWSFVQIGRLDFIIRVLIYSGFVALALEPAVNWLEKRGVKRGLGTGLVMLLAAVVVIVIVASMIPLVLGEAQNLAARLPDWVATIDKYLERWFGVSISQHGAASASAYLKDHFASWADNIATGVFGLARSAISLVFELLTLTFFSFYFTADGPRIRRGVCSLFRPAWQRAILEGWNVSIQKMGGFLYSRLILATVITIATFVALKILGVPYALPIAIWLAFWAEFIPNVGTYIGAIVPLLVCLIERGPAPTVVLLVFIVVYQQFENYILSPRVSAHTMELHPAVAFGAAIVGGSLFGIMGAFLALPAAAIVQAMISTYVHRYDLIDSELLREPPAEPPRAGKAGRPKIPLLHRGEPHGKSAEAESESPS